MKSVDFEEVAWKELISIALVISRKDYSLGGLTCALNKPMKSIIIYSFTLVMQSFSLAWDHTCIRLHKKYICDLTVLL